MSRAKRIRTRQWPVSQVDLDELANEILSRQDLTHDELAVLADKQNFTTDPRLALAYFHCCGSHPDAFVHNDESIRASSSLRARLTQCLDPPPGQLEAVRCQRSAMSHNVALSACASCCEMVEGNDDSVAILSISQLHSNFRVAEQDFQERYGHLSQEILTRHVQLVRIGNQSYYLNPELVPDPDRIVLCRKCATDPQASQFSIANGHDYGLIGNLPTLNQVASSCVAPVRCFGLELSLSGTHSSGHAICFPSSGPVVCRDVLPSIDVEDHPRVTFIGPADEWRLKRGLFRSLYEFPVDSVYAWLRVLSNTHSYFRARRITVDESNSSRRSLVTFQEQIDTGVVVDNTLAAHQVLDGVSSERYGEDCTVEIPLASDGILLHSSAVMKSAICEGSTVKQTIVDAMLATLNCGENVSNSPTTVIVRRDRDPHSEWDENGETLGAAFPTLFITGGHMLPNGSLHSTLLKHFMVYYDGRFESNVSFVATAFNQVQRHAAVQKAAAAGTNHAKLLSRFGTLASSDEFKSLLLNASRYPESSDSKRLNAELLRFLSLVGGTVPFSPFERTCTRPKILGMRYKFGIAQHFVTVAPPEHDNLNLHRIILLRQTRRWNDRSCIYNSRDCKWSDLPDVLTSSPRYRLTQSNRFPALAALEFERSVKVITDDILRCPLSQSVRVSRNYNQRESGAYGKIAGYIGVVEPQQDGRLHCHMTLYNSSYTPELLTRMCACPSMRQRAAHWIDAVSLNKVMPATWKWRNSLRNVNQPIPRACELTLPDARISFTAFQAAVERQVLATNIHEHSGTCRKGKRGKYMCRLCRPAGIHDGPTEPLQVELISAGDFENGIRPELHWQTIDDDVSDVLDSGYDTTNGQFLRPPTPRSIIWQQHRSEADSLFVETNTILAGLSGAHTNSSLSTGEDEANAVEAYQLNYLVKEGHGLKNAAAVLLSALEHITKYPSVAEDRSSTLRTAKYLATRTVNAFSGSHEWPHALMVYALLGHRSYFSSDSFWYIFPHSVLSYMRQNQLLRDRYCSEMPEPNEVDIMSIVSQQPSEYATQQDGNEEMRTENIHNQLSLLADLMATNNADNNTAAVPGGARSFIVGGKIIFLSQAQSYHHRGANFAAFSQLEFECIVDILPRLSLSSKTSQHGRRRRPGFDLGYRHPLFASHQGFIRTKLLTPIYGGPPPPSPTKNDTSGKSRLDDLAQYLLCCMVPWDIGSGRPAFPMDTHGLGQLCDSWDRRSAHLINRQRYRFIHNVLQKVSLSSKHEQTCMLWRNRNADLWAEIGRTADTSSSHPVSTTGTGDSELSGRLSSEDALFYLATMGTLGNPVISASIRQLRDSFWTVVLYNHRDSVSVVSASTANPERPTLYVYGTAEMQVTYPNFSDVAKQVQTMAAPTLMSVHNGFRYVEDTVAPRESNSISENDSVRAARLPEGERSLSIDQQNVLQWIDTHSTVRQQALTLVHGSAGTGKTYLIECLCARIGKRGLKAICTCPTGAGASQLPSGQTFHSAFKVHLGSRLSPSALANMRAQFDERVDLIVIDEVSMMSTTLLVLLDDRLRTLYDPNLIFGGISILLVGDFWQLEVLMGMSLCKVMYSNDLSPKNIKARALFSKFKTFFLRKQQRADGCNIQQFNLAACQQLPERYPPGLRWTKTAYRPIGPEVVKSVTSELRAADVVDDPRWLDDSTILVTSNTDKAVMIGCTVRLYARRRGLVACRWKRKCTIDQGIPEYLIDRLYDEDLYPSLFAYFVPGARAQIRDNGNGNLSWGLANGTACKMHSLAWNDPQTAVRMESLIREGVIHGTEVVDLEVPPDYINVQLTDHAGNVLRSDKWPLESNLETKWVTDSEGINLYKQSVIVPIGIARSRNDKHVIKLPRTPQTDPLIIPYEQHAVDLAMAMTIWKAQGATLNRVILLLQGSPGAPHWKFEHIYVGLSRVRKANLLRCFPLPPLYNSGALTNLRPSIYTIKWRMDIGPDGYWRQRQVQAHG